MFLISSFYILKGCNSVHRACSSPQWITPTLSSFLSHLILSSQETCFFLWICSNRSMTFCTGNLRAGHDTIGGVSQTQGRAGKSPPLTRWPWLFFMKPRIWLVFWAANAPCWLISNFFIHQYPQVCLCWAAFHPLINSSFILAKKINNAAQQLWKRNEKMWEKQPCRHQCQWKRKGQICTMCQSRGFPVACGEDHGDRGCHPAAYGGPYWSRYSPFSPTDKPTMEQAAARSCSLWKGALAGVGFLERPVAHGNPHCSLFLKTGTHGNEQFLRNCTCRKDP